jgi:hypothetical protein
MSDTKKEIDQDKGDEVLKRMLKTPPKPDIKKPVKEQQDKVRFGDSRRSSTN